MRSTRSELASIFGEYREEFEGRLSDLAEYESEFEARNLSNVGWESVIPAPRQVRAAVFTQPLLVKGADGGKLLTAFVKDFSDGEVAKLSNAVRQAAYEGLTVRELRQRIRGTRSRNYQDGLLAVTARNADAIARTSVQHVSAVARQETWKANSDVVIGYRWLSTLDGKTSTLCRSLDGQVFKFDQGPVPPAHIRCRSTTLAELAERFADLDAGGTRAARSTTTGKTVDVPQGETFYSWLKQQSPEFQDEVIGPFRGRLLREGGLSAQRFAQLQLDRNFRPLTLVEMRKLEPLAFQRAFGERKIPGGGSTPPPVPVRRFSYQDYQPVKRVADAERYLVDNKITDDAQLKGTSIEGLNVMLPAMHEAAERYKLQPLAGIGSLAKYGYRVPRRAQAAIASRVRSETTGNRGIFHAPGSFGRRSWADEQKRRAEHWGTRYHDEKERILNALRDGTNRFGTLAPEVDLRARRMKPLDFRFTVDAGMDFVETTRATVFHEYGHVLHLINETIGADIDAFLSAEQPLRNGWQYLLSKYAGTNSKEYVAEAFTVYMSLPKAQHFRIHPKLLEIFKQYDEAAK
ncbi:MAG: minor capsid protein [Pseudomonadota bacterium]